MPAAVLTPGISASPRLVVLMPYFLTSDTAGGDPRFWTLAAGRPALVDRLQAAWMRLHAWTSHHRHNGYLTHAQALQLCHGRLDTLDLLCTPVLGERPLLHRRGDRCDGKNCIDSSPPWTEGFEYRLCEFSKRNPTRAENDRHQAQKADSRDTRLKNEVYERDAGCCRYCRSGPLRRKGMARARDRRRVLQYDHVDPDQAAGPDAANYVVACARCNEYKGHRTPDEAGMTLLPEPTDSERAEWSERAETLFNLPDDGSRDNDNDNAPDNDQDNAHDKQHGCHSRSPDGCPDGTCTGDNPTAQPCPAPGETPAPQATNSTFEGSGPGRVGQPRVVPESPPVSGPGRQPIRGPDAPDIYHRRSRGGDP